MSSARVWISPACSRTTNKCTTTGKTCGPETDCSKLYPLQYSDFTKRVDIIKILLYNNSQTRKSCVEKQRKFVERCTGFSSFRWVGFFFCGVDARVCGHMPVSVGREGVRKWYNYLIKRRKKDNEKEF